MTTTPATPETATDDPREEDARVTITMTEQVTYDETLTVAEWAKLLDCQPTMGSVLAHFDYDADDGILESALLDRFTTPDETTQDTLRIVSSDREWSHTC